MDIEEQCRVRALAHLERVLHAARPHVELPAADRVGIDPVLVDAAPAGDQAAQRGQYPRRVAVGLYDARVRVDLEQHLQVPHVRGVLEHPAPVWTA